MLRSVEQNANAVARFAISENNAVSASHSGTSRCVHDDPLPFHQLVFDEWEV